VKSYGVQHLIRGSSLTATERQVLNDVVLYADGDEGLCFASQETIAENTALGSRTVRRDLATLTRLGILEEVDDPSRRTKTYRVVPAAIPARPAATPAPHAGLPGTTCRSPRQDVPVTPAPRADKQIREETNDQSREEQPAPPRRPTTADPLVVAELVALQEAAEPQHGFGQERDANALVRALLRGVEPDALRALWAWSGLAADPDAEACRRGGWRRWSSLLRQPLGDARIRDALAWEAAGRPRAGPGPPRRGQSTAGDGAIEEARRQLREARHGDSGRGDAVLGGDRGDRPGPPVVEASGDRPGGPGLGGGAR
jgi:hypothetical protein